MVQWKQEGRLQLDCKRWPTRTRASARLARRDKTPTYRVIYWFPRSRFTLRQRVDSAHAALHLARDGHETDIFRMGK